jgi:Calcineurin-like phosphoesterase
MSKITTRKKSILRIACIDDDRSRDEIYSLFFDAYSSSESSHFTIVLEIPPTPEEAIRVVKSRQVHGAIVDVLLTRKWNSTKVEDLVEVMRSTKLAIGFVSGDMGQETAVSELRKHMTRLSDNPKLGYFTYFDSFKRQFFNSSDDALSTVRIASRLREEVIALWNIILMGISSSATTIWRESDSANITFLHLTDTHFGRVDVGQMSVEGIVDLVRQQSIVIDALLWTGDIADKGLPSDYSKARKFYDDLVVKGVITAACPVFAVAGNHDQCWPLSLSVNIYKTEGKWLIGDKPNDDYRQLVPYRVQPFSEFYEGITGRKLDAYKKGFAWIDTYIRAGILVLEFSIEDFGIYGIDVAGGRDIDKIAGAIFDELREIESRGGPNFSLILLLVHGRDPSKETEIHFNIFMTRLAAKGYPLVVAGGHYHVGTASPVGSVLYVIGTPVDAKVLAGMTVLPGVPFLSLSAGTDGAVECDVTTYKFERNILGVDEHKYTSLERFRLRNDGGKYAQDWIKTE